MERSSEERYTKEIGKQWA